MRKILLALILMGGVFLFLGAGASTASAASCTAQEGFTYYDGALAFSANLVNCTGVDAVQFRNQAYPGAMWAGWHDFTNLGDYQATPVGDFQVGGGPGMTGASFIFHRWPWCAGQTHQIRTYYDFRIHNSAGGGSWGAWYRRTSPQYGIWC